MLLLGQVFFFYRELLNSTKGKHDFSKNICIYSRSCNIFLVNIYLEKEIPLMYQKDP